MPDLNIVVTADQLANLLLRAQSNARKSVAIRIDPNLLIHLIQNYQPPAK